MPDMRVDFSLRREVFFVVIGAIVGAGTMVIPKTIFDVGLGLPYYLTWIVFGRVLDVYSYGAVFAGMALHLLTATSIGIIVGIFLYKTGVLNISKLSNGLVYGLFAGAVVFALFYIPVQQLVLAPETASTLAEIDPSLTEQEAAQQLSGNILMIMIGSVIMHEVFGVTLGTVSSLLSVKFGARYRCHQCDISFARIDAHQKHMELVHGAEPIELKKILILGGGFAGVNILNKLQEAFRDDVGVDITMVSRDNFFLFTPMLPEVASGMIETRHIVTPIRVFCNRAKFYEANVDSIDLHKKQVQITHAIGRQGEPIDWYRHTLSYDYLVLALGSETNYFNMEDVKQNVFTMKTLDDAIVLRNHVINMLEQADLEHENPDVKQSLTTFVVVGGGFAGVETVGELNDFIRDSINDFYHNLDAKDAKIILVNSGSRLLPEVSDDLAEFALQNLRNSGVEVILNTRLEGASIDRVKLNNGQVIPSHTVVWTGGVTQDELVTDLPCEHDRKGRVVANNYFEVEEFPGVYTVGDCASIINPNTGDPYPPTAQHAIRQGRVAAVNIVSSIRGGKKFGFDYETKGMMAKIGKRNGVGIVFGSKIQGFAAWWLWRTYYWANLPTLEKKLRVVVDWTIDLFFKRDVARLKTFREPTLEEERLEQREIVR